MNHVSHCFTVFKHGDFQQQTVKSPEGSIEPHKLLLIILHILFLFKVQCFFSEVYLDHQRQSTWKHEQDLNRLSAKSPSGYHT